MSAGALDDRFQTQPGQVCERAGHSLGEDAGHLWPTPEPESTTWLDDAYGSHNQDVDASDAIGDYFMSLA